MADTKISDLPAVTSPTNTMGVAVNNAGNSERHSFQANPITAAETSSGLVAADLDFLYPVGNVLRYGADPTGLSDSTSAIQDAIDAVAEATALNSGVPAYTWITEIEGGIVYFPRGWYRIDSSLTLGNRVSLVGENFTSAGIVAGSGYTDSTMISGVDGSLPIFDSRIQDLRIHANNDASITSVISTQAWQEGCGLYRVAVAGYQGEGILIEDVSGGAARIVIDDCWFTGFSGNNAAIHVESTVQNAMQIVVTNTTIDSSGLATNGIHQENGRGYYENVHVENATNGIHFEGGNGTVKNFTGNADTVNCITINASFNGNVDMYNIEPNGATLTIDDNATSQNMTVGFRHAHWPFRRQFTNADDTPSVTQQGAVYRTNNSGATTITDFDNGTPGQRFMLRFQDANTTIDCSSNANITRVDSPESDITGASGDWCDIWDDGGVWFIIFHDIA